MQDNEANELTTLFLEYKFHEHKLVNINNHFKKINFNIIYFNTYLSKELNDLELKVFNEHIIHKKNLNILAREFDYSYSYIKKIYQDVINKISILIKFQIAIFKELT